MSLYAQEAKREKAPSKWESNTDIRKIAVEDSAQEVDNQSDPLAHHRNLIKV